MRSYETFSTTADAGIRFRGRDFRELYGNALRGLNLLLFGANPRRTAGCASAAFSFRGDGPENVLVNLLSEALDQVYGRRRRVAGAVFRRAGGKALEARLLLAPWRRPPRLEIKSVTYHNLRVRERGGMLRAAVLFDI
jgi:SHS2 domain-containing protein